MKILRIDSNPAASPVLMADSTYRPDRRPLFLPDTDGSPVRCVIKVAVVIDRLGKCISRRFVPRYVGALQLVNIMTGGKLNDFSDDTLIHGSRFEIPEGPVVFDCNPGGEVTFTYPAEKVAELIEEISSNATFKTGDLVILPEEIVSYTPCLDMNVSVKLHDTTILEFSVK